MQQVKFISCRLRCFLLLLLFYGCGNADRNSFQSGNNYPLIHVDISRAEKIPDLKNVFADISFIPLETKESSIIAEITRVIYSNSRYYLLDKSAQSLKIFDTTGKFIRSIGAIGDGPGEYKKLNNFTKILGLPIGKPLGIKDSDHFISSIPVPRLMTVLNHNNKAFSKEVIEKDYPMLNKLLPSLKNSANPILTVFKFKDNIFGPGD